MHTGDIIMTVRRCPGCHALWTIASNHIDRCTVCGRPLQDWAELRDSPSFIEMYKDVGQYGI